MSTLAVCRKTFTMTVIDPPPTPTFYWNWAIGEVLSPTSVRTLDVVSGIKYMSGSSSTGTAELGAGAYGQGLVTTNGKFSTDFGSGLYTGVTLENNWTICGWFKYTAPPFPGPGASGILLVISTGGTKNISVQWIAVDVDYSLKLRIFWSQSGVVTITDTIFLTQDEWHFIFVSYNKTTNGITFRVDDRIMTGTAPTNFTVDSQADRLNILSTILAVADYDEWGLWRTVELSESDGDFIYNGGTARTYPWA